eukprot:1343835-Amorphochlora_amoeboformis.AAC.1
MTQRLREGGSGERETERHGREKAHNGVMIIDNFLLVKPIWRRKKNYLRGEPSGSQEARPPSTAQPWHSQFEILKVWSIRGSPGDWPESRSITFDGSGHAVFVAVWPGCLQLLQE